MKNPWNKLFFSPVMLLVLGAGALLLFWPNSDLRTSNLGDFLVSSGKYFFPVINSYAALSSYSHQVELYLSLLFLSSPLIFMYVCFSWKKMGFESFYEDEMKARTRKQRYGFAFGIPFLILCFSFGVFGSAQDPSFCKGCTSDSRFGLLIITHCSLLGGLVFVRIGYWFYSNLRLILSFSTTRK